MSAENLGGVWWFRKNALFRTSTVVLSVWGNAEKYKWGPETNPCTPDLRTPNFVPKAAVRSLPMLTHADLKVMRGDTTIIPTEMKANREGATEPGFEPRLSHPKMLSYGSLSAVSDREA